MDEELTPADNVMPPADAVQEAAVPPMQMLEALAASQNLAAHLPDDRLGEIAIKVIDEYEIDCESRQEWVDRTDAALDLAMMVAEEKDYPFNKASNIKWPLLTTAALQFNARAYPAIVQGNRVAKCETWGSDPNGLKAARAERVSEHLSYQLLSELPEWETDTDKLLVTLPIVGSCFRKIYFDPSLGRTCTRLVQSKNLIVNYFARSVKDAPRTTEEMYLYPYEIEERIRDGRYVDFEYKSVFAPAESDDKKDKRVNEQDGDAPRLFLEQHRLLDLDEDGYSEPYIVTVHPATQKVVRIVANFDQGSVVPKQDGTVASIRKRDYYVQYSFLPSPDGGVYGWGFGWLLKDIQETINSTANQMMDAGHLANVQGGFISASAGIKEKHVKLKMGEFRTINTMGPISSAILPVEFPGPSAVLFNLLGMLVDAGKEIASIKDVLSGDTPATAPVGTTMALIEQGLQVFTSIFKRIHRSLKEELGLHAKLNRQYLDPQRYSAFHEMPADPRADYSEADMDITPVSDPSTVSKTQTIAKAMFLMEMSDKDMKAGMPILDRAAVYKRVLEAAQIEDTEKLFMPPPQPNPEEEALKRVVAMLALKDQEAEILKKHTDALKNVATAEAAEDGTQIAAMQAYLSFLQSQIEARSNGQGRVPGLEGQPGNAMGAQGAPAQGGPDAGPPQGAPVQGGAPAGVPMGGPAIAGRA